jgi:hypothetical protein
MAGIQKTVLWTLAVCVFGYMAINVKAPGQVQAQVPSSDARATPDSAEADKGGGTPVHGSSGAQRSLSSAKQDSMSVPQPESTVRAYVLQYNSPIEVAKIIDSVFAGRIRMISRDDRHLMVMVEADAETQDAIRELIKDLERVAQPVPTRRGDSAMSMPLASRGSEQGVRGLAQPHQKAAEEQVRAARQKLTDATTEDEIRSARAELRRILADIFSHDMQMREKRAAEIETRLSKLRQQYQEREKVKDKIIDLQLKVIEADAAGLGFPGGGSFRLTPPFSSRGGRAPSADAPAQRADQHDPIPTERTLDEAKRTYPTVVAELQNRGHFIESADGRFYAYANVDQRLGRSVIRVIDSKTGKLVATGMINARVGPLQFTNEGVASREADNSIQFRVPLKKHATRDGDTF